MLTKGRAQLKHWTTSKSPSLGGSPTHSSTTSKHPCQPTVHKSCCSVALRYPLSRIALLRFARELMDEKNIYPEDCEMKANGLAAACIMYARRGMDAERSSKVIATIMKRIENRVRVGNKN